MTDQNSLVKPHMVEGEIFNLGGQDYVVPALNLRGYRELKEDIKFLNESKSISSDKHIEVICRVVLKALQRNYPSMTVGELEEKIDLDNCLPLLTKVLKMSGLKKSDSSQGEVITQNQ